MRVVKLKEISLLSSNVAASIYDEYNASTAYAVGATVKVSYESDGTTPRWPVEEFESNVASNTGNYPPDDTTNWYPLGTENRGAMFDEYLNTQTNNTETISVEIDAGRCDIIGLFELQAKSVTLTHIVEKELITDGDCSSDSFTAGSGWVYDGVNDEYDCTGSQTNSTMLSQQINTAPGKQYQVQFTVLNYSAGSIAGLAGGVAGETISSNGTFTQIILAGTAAESGIIADADFTGSVTDISIKKVPRYETISLVTGTNKVGWHSYLFSSREYKKSLLWDFPWYSNATLRIKITWVPGDLAKCGMVGIGEQRYLGIVRGDLGLNLLDYSIKAKDAFGRATLSKGEGADENEYDFWASEREIDRIYGLLKDLRGERVIFDANDPDARYIITSLIICGFYRDLKVTIPGKIRSKYTLYIEGLI